MTISEYHREFPDCAICNYPETVIHHIILKGMGGSKIRDVKNNWVSLCSLHHKIAHHLIKNYHLSKQELFEAKMRMERREKKEIIFGKLGGLKYANRGI